MALVAPARSADPDDVASAVRLFESWGLKVMIPDGLYESEGQFAGSDACRASVFQEAIDDPSVKAVCCVRGGYGSVRIVDRIDFSSLLASPKWLIGYSDATVFHSHLSRMGFSPTLHAIMPINFPGNGSGYDCPALNSLHDVLFKGHGRYEFSDGLSCGLNRIGRTSGQVVGGNLSVLYSLLGSASDVDTDGKILLIEDLDEYLYHIDRMMMALKRAGKLSVLRGLIVGAMSQMHDNTVPFGKTAEQIVLDAVAEYSYPVAFHCPFGHIGTENLALPLGLPVNFEVGEKGAIVSF